MKTKIKTSIALTIAFIAYIGCIAFLIADMRPYPAFCGFIGCFLLAGLMAWVVAYDR